MTEITCACGCGRKKMVRVADRKRGWGKYFDKSCKARHQESRTGQYSRFLARGKNPENWDEYTYDDYLNELHPFSSEALGQWQD